MKTKWTLLLVFPLLALGGFENSAVGQPIFAELTRFDINTNCLIENGEIFAIFDAWNAGRISNGIFFEAVDLWIAQMPLTNCGQTATCEFNGDLRASYQGDQAFVPIIRSSAEVDLFFTGENFLPIGTSISLNISTNVQELAITGGGFVSQFRGSFFTMPNPNFAIGTGVTAREGFLSQGREFASFRLQVVGAGTPLFTQISISATIHRPDCDAVQRFTSFDIGVGSSS